MLFGGGKRARGETVSFVFLKEPAVQADDMQVYKDAAMVRDINIEGWLLSLPMASLKEVEKLAESSDKSRGGSLFVNSLMKYVKEYASISVRDSFCLTSFRSASFEFANVPKTV